MIDIGALFDLSGQVAAVTGGASGIGEAICEVLASAGAAVVVADIDAEGAGRTAGRIVDEGGRALAVTVDTTKRADNDAMVDAALGRYGRLDVLCTMAGVSHRGLLSDVAEEEVDRLIAVNLKGVLFGCQAAMRVMRPQGSGNIVTVSSSAIDQPGAGSGLYGMTKAAVAMMSMVLADEGAPYGIRVNVLAPGLTVTNFSRHHGIDENGVFDQGRLDAWLEERRAALPLHLLGEARDQAYLVLYLVSAAGRLASGNIFRVNGGEPRVW